MLLALSACAPEPTPQVDDLPVTVLPVAKRSPVLVLAISGDGGWAGLDDELAKQLNERGVPVVGLSSLKYFWKRRTPEETTADVARLLRHYLAEWHVARVVLVGYSFGADVMPFVYNRLPTDLRERVSGVALLAVGERTDFEVHVAGWVGVEGENGLPIAPELARMGGIPVLCLWGDGDDDAEKGCTHSRGPLRTTLKVGDGHHFGYLHAELASQILARVAH
ncbi:MAG: AcvB/VirJ family lysyl-phosphatidylglycerol hydrolase [Steroidobacteraceae bacterium]